MAPPPAVAAGDAQPADETAGKTVLTISPLWPVWPLNGALGGSLCEVNSCSSVPYMPFSTVGGVHALDRRLSAVAASDGGADTVTDTPTVVFAFSNGAMVASEWMAEHADDPDAPSPDEVSFVLIGNPTTGLRRQAARDTAERLPRRRHRPPVRSVRRLPG